MTTTTKIWAWRAACDAVDVRDMDRSVMSAVPKQSGPNGQYSRHHRLLRSRGGNDSPANLVLLTGSGTTGEHGWIHQHPGEATVLGYMIPTGMKPEETPIWRLDIFGIRHGWHLQIEDQLEPCPPPEHHTPDVIAAALAAFDALMTESRLAAIKHL